MKHAPQVLSLPRVVVGVVGGGQLGRMLALEARRMGVRTAVWTGGREAPAVEVADEVIDLPFDDPAGLRQFLDKATVATVEFENIPRATLCAVADRIPLHPSPEVIGICQNRELEKTFLRQHGLPCARFEVVNDADQLRAAMRSIGGPCVLKTAAFGYDGSGQRRLAGDEDAAMVWEAFGAQRGVLEEWVDFERELSVMVARGADGVCVCYDPAENRHRSHILDLSIVPARVSGDVSARAAAIACRVADAFGYRGILGVELFLKADGSLLVNEMAPRPHNSGHHTIDACETSQFEQQLRMVLGLPAGSTRLLAPAVMLNLLGDLWRGATDPPDWTPLFEDGRASLHLYGKRFASPRRKMGHATFLASDPGEALARAESLKQRWLEEAAAAQAGLGRD